MPSSNTFTDTQHTFNVYNTQSVQFGLICVLQSMIIDLPLTSIKKTNENIQFIIFYISYMTEAKEQSSTINQFYFTSFYRF